MKPAKMTRIANLVQSILAHEVTIEELREERAAAGAQVRELLDNCESDRSNLTALMDRQIDIMDADHYVPLVKAVLDHANAKYAKGWDIIIEATTIEELIGAIGASRTTHGAISRVAKVLAIQTNYSYMRDIQGA